MALENIVTIVTVIGAAIGVYLNYRKFGNEVGSARHKELMDIISVLTTENSRLKAELEEAERDCGKWRAKYKEFEEARDSTAK